MVVIHRRDDADAPRFDICGELTVDCAVAFRDELRRLLAQHAQLCLNLAGVDAFDSSAVQVMLHAQREAVRTGVTLQWLGFSPAVMDVVQLLNLHDELRVAALKASS